MAQPNQPIEDIFADQPGDETSSVLPPQQFTPQAPLPPPPVAPAPIDVSAEGGERPMQRVVGRGSKIRLMMIIIAGLFILAAVGAFAYVQWKEADSTSETNTNTSNRPTNQSGAGATINTATNTSLTTSTTTDTDGDGLLDSEEEMLGTLSTDSDTDNDQLTDRQEVKIYKTNPLNSDTDGDGYPDGEEVRRFYNPNGPGKMVDIVNAIGEFESQ